MSGCRGCRRWPLPPQRRLPPTQPILNAAARSTAGQERRKDGEEEREREREREREGKERERSEQQADGRTSSTAISSKGLRLCLTPSVTTPFLSGRTRT